MDIGIIFPYMETYGGAQIYALECIKRWQKKHDITFYSVIYNQELFEDYSLDMDIVKIDIPYKTKFMNFPLLFQHKLASKYLNNHEIYNSHMFPCHSLDIDNNIWCPQEPSRILYDLEYLMKKESLPVRGLYKLSAPILRHVDKRNYKAARTVANSNYSKKYLESVYNISISDIVYPGVDTEKFNNNKTDKSEKMIIMVSRLYKEKNVDIGIKALSQLDKEYTMKIVGTGPYLESLKKLCIKLGVEDRVQFLDFVGDKQLVSLYKQATYLIFLPYKEPFGMVALEALSAGTPVIGLKNGGGYSELIKDGFNGYLVDFDSSEIAEKIKIMENDENLYNQMKKNCKKTAEDYTWDKTADQFMKVFENYLTMKTQ